MLTEILRGVLIQLPVLLVCAVGIVVAFVSWRRSPVASLWTLLAFGLALLLCVLMPVGQQTMWYMVKESNVDTRITVNTVLGVIWSVLRAVTYILLLVGVYAGRKSTLVAPAAIPPALHAQT